MSEGLKPDLCLIGAGSAGLPAMARGASHGASVVLIERGRRGRDSLLNGCIPTKASITAGERRQSARGAQTFGIGPGGREPSVRLDWERDHIRPVIASASNDSGARDSARGRPGAYPLDVPDPNGSWASCRGLAEGVS